MLKFKVGDKVIVKSGKDKGREGTVGRVFAKEQTAVLDGINMYKKHVKPTMTQDGKGGIFDIARPISLSKLALIDPKTKKPTRIGFRMEGKRKVRIAKKSGMIIDKVS